MGKIRVRVKAPFGEVVIEGESAQEILETLKTMPPQFVNEVGNLISTNLTPSLKTQLDGIIELTTEGPILTTREKLTHYEAIALILFASENHTSTATQLKKLLASSGIRSMVPGGPIKSIYDGTSPEGNPVCSSSRFWSIFDKLKYRARIAAGKLGRTSPSKGILREKRRMMPSGSAKALAAPMKGVLCLNRGNGSTY